MTEMSKVAELSMDLDKIEEQLLDELTDPNSKTNNPVSMQELLARVDKAEFMDEDYLNATVLELTTLKDRLHHRADMMRRRAVDFDGYADDIGNRIEWLKEAVLGLRNHIKNIEELLKRHAHIEPDKIINGE